MRTTKATTAQQLGESTTGTEPTSVLAALRALAPARPLTSREALIIAEHQAAALRQLSGTSGAYAFPAEVIAELPRIEIREVEGLPVSGMCRWQGQSWQIAVAEGDAPVRQRFTIAHEMKHVIDHTHRTFLPDGMTEKMADYFAACLLMPKRLVVRLWGQGVQDIEVLADQFEVSTAAMRVRLAQIGLARPSRCPGGMHSEIQTKKPWERPTAPTSPAPVSRAWT